MKKKYRLNEFVEYVYKNCLNSNLIGEKEDKELIATDRTETLLPMWT